MDTVSSETNTISPKVRINWKFQFQQYGTAFTVALPLFVTLSFYLFFRRGYYDLYIANKIFAGTAAIMLGIVLLIGPGSRLFSFPDRLIQYRKELGIVAFISAFIHAINSLFLLPSKFPLLGFLKELLLPFIFGLTALITLISIFVISLQNVKTTLDNKKWWQMQYWGIRSVFLLVFLHVFVMKWSGWVGWYRRGGGKELIHPEWPGAGLLVGWFMTFVVLLRLAEFVSPKLRRVIWYVSSISLPIIYIATFWWGNQLFK